MIYILFGEDTYRSRQKLKEIVEEYRKKAGPVFNLEKLDAEENDLAPLKNMIQGGSLFSAKKLIVVEGAFFSDQSFSYLAEAVRSIKDVKDIFLILWDRSLSTEGLKRLEEVRALADKVQEFKFLTGLNLQNWIEVEAQKRGLKLYPAQFAHLAYFGSNLWGLSNELAKMALTEIADFRKQDNQQYNIFQLGDTFFSSAKIALGVFLNLLHQGHDDFSIFSYLVNHGRTLLTVKIYLDRGVTVPSYHQLHPFVVKKASALARGLSQEELRILLQKFFEEDFKIKVGLSNPKESLLRILLG